MRTKAEFRAGRIVWMFNKSGSEGEQTRFFENLPTETRELVRQSCGLRPNEIMVLGYVPSATEWVLATSERVMWLDTGEVSFVDYLRLEDATVNNEDVIRAQGMKRLNTLVLVTVDGERIEITLEQGRPFCGFWNALKMMARIVSD